MDLSSFKLSYAQYIRGLPAPKIASVFKKIKTCNDPNDIIREILMAKEAHLHEKLQKHTGVPIVVTTDTTTNAIVATETMNNATEVAHAINDSPKASDTIQDQPVNENQIEPVVAPVITPVVVDTPVITPVVVDTPVVTPVVAIAPMTAPVVAATPAVAVATVVAAVAAPELECDDRFKPKVKPKYVIPPPTQEQLNAYWGPNYDVSCKDLKISSDLLKTVLYEKRMKIVASETHNGKKTAASGAVESRIQKLYTVLDDALLLQEYNSRRFQVLTYLAGIDT